MLSDDGRRLIASAAPSMPPRLVDAAAAVVMEPGNEPMLGRNDPAECADFAEHRGQYDADFLVDVGYRAGWSVPVVDTQDAHVVGTIAVLYVAPRLPSMRERDVVAVATHLASIAIERHRRQLDLEHQARHDHLTGLPNRRAILDRLAHAIDQSERPELTPAVLLLDLDRFKVVNDSLGHAAGDELLVAFGERLRVVTGDTAFVGHFGGDEFVVVLDSVADVSDALAVASRIELALSEPFTVQPLPDTQYELHLAASIGVALATGDDRAHEVLQHADAAMHRAKAGGHDRIAIFDDELQARATELLHVDRELRMAVERAELTLHYQPKVDLATGGIIGVEALLRWEHPEKGLVAPSAFIEVAEETGLIVRIGRWVLEEAVRQARVWTDRLALDSWIVAVNLSARQLTASDLVPHVATVLQRNDWPADRLVLELTESILIDDAEATLGVLAGPQAARREARHRRLRHRLLVAELPPPLPRRHREDRPGLRRATAGQRRGLSGRHGRAAHGTRARTHRIGRRGRARRSAGRACARSAATSAQGFLFSRAVPADEITALLADQPRW